MLKDRSYRRPHSWTGCAAHSADHKELRKLLVSLEQRLLGEQLAQDAAAAPHVDRGAVPLLPQQQFWGSEAIKTLFYERKTKNSL